MRGALRAELRAALFSPSFFAELDAVILPVVHLTSVYSLEALTDHGVGGALRDRLPYTVYMAVPGLRDMGTSPGVKLPLGEVLFAVNKWRDDPAIRLYKSLAHGATASGGTGTSFSGRSRSGSISSISSRASGRTRFGRSAVAAAATLAGATYAFNREATQLCQLGRNCDFVFQRNRADGTHGCRFLHSADDAKHFATVQTPPQRGRATTPPSRGRGSAGHTPRPSPRTAAVSVAAGDDVADDRDAADASSGVEGTSH